MALAASNVLDPSVRLVSSVEAVAASIHLKAMAASIQLEAVVVASIQLEVGEEC